MDAWQSYIIILESLDNKQSHLIMPSLKLLETIKLKSIWMEFVILELMKHTNNVVLKWSVKYLLNNYICSDFRYFNKILDKNAGGSENLIRTILLGFNHSFLYCNSILSTKQFQKFIENNLKEFIDQFLTIDWKSVPLHFFMTLFNDSVVSKELRNICSHQDLLKISAKIRRIECKMIRNSIRGLFWTIFVEHLKQSSNLNEIFQIFDTIFNPNELMTKNDCLLHKILFSKIKETTVVVAQQQEQQHQNLNQLKSEKYINNFSYKILEILFNSPELHDMHDDSLSQISIIFCSCNINLENAFKGLLLSLNQQNDKMAAVKLNFKQHIKNLLKTNLDNLNDEETLFINNLLDASFDQNKILKLDDLDNVRGQFSQIKELFVALYIENFKIILNNVMENVSSENKDSMSQSFEKHIPDLLDKGGMMSLKYIVDVIKYFEYNIFKKNAYEMKLGADIIERILKDIKYYYKQFGSGSMAKLVADFVSLLIMKYNNYSTNYILMLLDLDGNSVKLHYLVFQSIKDNLLNNYNESNEKNKFYESDMLVEILLCGLLFGEPILGEKRLELDYIISNDLTLGITAADVRRICIYIINFMSSKKTIFNSQLLKLKNLLLEKSLNLSNKKSRYFKSSKHHRIKLRIVQSLAILNDPKLELNEWDDRYLIAIFNENNQSDVVQIMELLIAYTIPTQKILDLFSELENFSNTAIISLFVIGYLHCDFLRSIENDFLRRKNSIEDYLPNKLVKIFLPWTMGQNFNIRLQAQITIHNLIENFEMDEEYKCLLLAIRCSLKQGNEELNLKKLSHYRYLRDLSNCSLISLVNIFIPRFNDTARDEWYYECENCANDLFVVGDKRLLEISEKITSYNDNFDDEEVNVELDNVQRKISPTFQNKLDCDMGMINFAEDNCTKKVDMIVIASLVDKLPNLGGIARTCEVLGIKNLALSSLKYIEMKEFKGLSLTAEKWLNFKEVKPVYIQDYIMLKKSQGYKVVGAEQMSNSISFTEFKFPEKTLLLLGHEKEGIPPNLITLVDYAVEIQQFGMVRSLNVHVVGALFMWEYCKQHIMR